jgi:hypothetical protein
LGRLKFLQLCPAYLGMCSLIDVFFILIPVSGLRLALKHLPACDGHLSTQMEKTLQLTGSVSRRYIKRISVYHTIFQPLCSPPHGSPHTRSHNDTDLKRHNASATKPSIRTHGKQHHPMVPSSTSFFVAFVWNEEPSITSD